MSGIKLFKVCESLRKTVKVLQKVFFFLFKILECMSKDKKVNYSYITINKDYHKQK